MVKIISPWRFRHSFKHITTLFIKGYFLVDIGLVAIVRKIQNCLQGFVYVISNCFIVYPWKMAWPFILTNLQLFYPRVLDICQLFLKQGFFIYHPQLICSTSFFFSFLLLLLLHGGWFFSFIYSFILSYLKPVSNTKRT